MKSFLHRKPAVIMQKATPEFQHVMFQNHYVICVSNKYGKLTQLGESDVVLPFCR
jgi:hypothetical protein